MAGSRDGGKRRNSENRNRLAAVTHPVRSRLLRLLVDGEEIGAGDLATELGEAPGRIAYHLRVLVKHDVLRIVPRCRPVAPLYRWSPGAEWARQMLDEIDARGSEGS